MTSRPTSRRPRLAGRPRRRLYVWERIALPGALIIVNGATVVLLLAGASDWLTAIFAIVGTGLWVAWAIVLVGLSIAATGAEVGCGWLLVAILLGGIYFISITVAGLGTWEGRDTILAVTGIIGAACGIGTLVLSLWRRGG